MQAIVQLKMPKNTSNQCPNCCRWFNNSRSLNLHITFCHIHAFREIHVMTGVMFIFRLTGMEHHSIPSGGHFWRCVVVSPVKYYYLRINLSRGNFDLSRRNNNFVEHAVLLTLLFPCTAKTTMKYSW